MDKVTIAKIFVIISMFILLVSIGAFSLIKDKERLSGCRNLCEYKDMEYKTKIYPNVAQKYVKKKIVLDEEKVVKINIDIEKGVVVFIQNRSIVDFENLELL